MIPYITGISQIVMILKIVMFLILAPLFGLVFIFILGAIAKFLIPQFEKIFAFADRYKNDSGLYPYKPWLRYGIYYLIGWLGIFVIYLFSII